MTLPSLRDADIEGKRVLIRFDGDVPSKGDVIADDYRLKNALPTMQWCLDHGASIVLLAHRGRPKAPGDKEFSNHLLVPYFTRALGREVTFYTDIPEKVTEPIALLENLRYWPGEEANDEAFAKSLAKLGDIYCNDAFAVSHRPHASSVGIPKYLPHFAGLHLVEEVTQLQSLIYGADDPYMMVLGGAKASDKSPIIADIIDKVDYVIIGGLICITYFAAQGNKIGKHEVEEEQVQLARQCIAKMHEHGVDLVLPVDIVTDKQEIKKVQDFSDNDLMLDIGPESIDLFSRTLHKANTIFWNGAMGKYEDPPFAKGTAGVAHGIITSGAEKRILSGGDTTAAVDHLKLQNGFTFISTGGGATLEFIAGRKLPGIEILMT